MAVRAWRWSSGWVTWNPAAARPAAWSSRGRAAARQGSGPAGQRAAAGVERGSEDEGARVALVGRGAAGLDVGGFGRRRTHHGTPTMSAAASASPPEAATAAPARATFDPYGDGINSGASGTALGTTSATSTPLI